MANSAWPPNNPETLSVICLSYCVKNLQQTVCDYDNDSDSFTLKPDVVLPLSVSDELSRMIPIQRQHFGIFRDTELCLWKRMNLGLVSDLTDSDLTELLAHRPVELRIPLARLTYNFIHIINRHSDSLQSLAVLGSRRIFLELCHLLHEEITCCVRQAARGGPETAGNRVFGGNYILSCPHLRSLTMNCVNQFSSDILVTTLCGLPSLTKLDLSDCDIKVENIDNGLVSLKSLQILRLHNVLPISSDIKSSFSVLARLTSLRVLDVGQSNDDSPYLFTGDTTAVMSMLMSSLPCLTHLDISGTNLAGFVKEQPESHRLTPHSTVSGEDEQCGGIPGINNRRLQFLGLLNCAYHACERPNLPAVQVTGDASEEQVLLSVETYVDALEFLVQSLNDLFHLAKENTLVNQRRALEAILNAMKQHRFNKLVQISGSASLFYIVKGESKMHLTTRLKKQIITMLLDAMHEHIVDATMIRNGCLTLGYFNLPHDVMVSYEDVVRLLLKILTMTYEPNDNFIQYIIVSILNSLACQVDYSEKQMLGDLGAVQTMLSLIRDRLSVVEPQCDEVMLYAWSLLWNVTDETDVNCRRFIDLKGLNIFQQCLEKFPDKEELLRNMMGLMGNIAEVGYLRPHLMQEQYVSIFSDLLLSKNDGIEVSYNACGVIANLMSDGAAAWTATTPSRYKVLDRMVLAVNSWPLSQKRNINYRSFSPILRLVPMTDCPQVQLWAVWALCNLTKVNRSKYCPLLESEGGLSLLEPISQNNKARFRQVQQLAQQVLRRCSQFRLSADSQSTDDLDQLSAASAADVNNVDMTDDSDNDVMDDDSDNDSALDY